MELHVYIYSPLLKSIFGIIEKSISRLFNELSLLALFFEFFDSLKSIDWLLLNWNKKPC